VGECREGDSAKICDVTKGIKREILHAVAESVTGKCTSGREADTDEVEGGTGELCGEDTAGSVLEIDGHTYDTIEEKCDAIAEHLRKKIGKRCW
jgi:hypothetical protein